MEGNDVRALVDGTERWYGQIRNVAEHPYGSLWDVYALDKAVILRDRVLDVRTQYVNQRPEDIADDLLKDEDGNYFLPGGLLADGFDEISYRAEEDDVLGAIDGLAKVVGAEWFTDRDGTDKDRFRLVVAEPLGEGAQFDVDQFDMGTFDQGLGASSTDSVQFGVDVVKISRKVDRETVRNDVVALGYGDGINQLRSRIFHASTSRTRLYSPLSASEAAEMEVDDASSFPTAGIVFVGMERVRYTGMVTTGTHKLTGLTREYEGDLPGKNRDSLAAYAHGQDVAVWLHADESGAPVYYDPQTAQTGSSIEVDGWKGGPPYVDRGVIDQSTLDHLAQRLLASYREPRESVIVRAKRSDFAAEVGDNVDVLDFAGAAYENSPYRLHSLQFARDEVTWELDLGSPRDVAEAELARLREELRLSRAYGQGATNAMTPQHAENIKGGSKNLLMDVTIPPEAVAVNHVKIQRLRLRPFESYGEGSGGGESVTSANNIDVDIETPADDDSGTVAVPDSTWTEVTAIPIPSHTDPVAMWFHFSNLFNTYAPEFIWWARLKETPANVYYPDSGGVQLCPVLDNDYLSCLLLVPKELTTSDTLRLEVRQTSGSSRSIWGASYVYGVEKHTHSVTTTDHTHPAEIVETAYSSPSVGLLVDGEDKTTEAGGPWATDQSDIDLTDLTPAGGFPGWLQGVHTLEFFEQAADKLGRVHASLYIQVFIRSE